MSKLTDQIRDLLEQCDEKERALVIQYLRQRTLLHPLEQEWGTTAEAILTAIARSNDLTQRGIRGILAEATFEETVLPKIEESGWKTIPIVGDQAYDFIIKKSNLSVRIQVKLQRRERLVPKVYSARARAALKCPSGTMYVVEVQKTRTGNRKGQKTRPYRFGDFDILAVNLHPSTGDWKRFIFTVAGWLLPRSNDSDLIEIYQPVPLCPDEYWTNDFNLSVDWFVKGETKRLYL